MKNFIKLFILILAFPILSCSSEDDGSAAPASSNTIEINFNENPRSGDLVTTVTTNLSGDVSFNLSSQSSSSAFTLDSNSGELRVANWQAFDFESNPVLTATIAVSNDTDSENKIIIINLNDIDDIWSFLNDSRANYESASEGEWIAISGSEYGDLANFLMDVTKVGASDSQYNRNEQKYYDDSYYTYANDNNAILESQNYLFAFKYTTNKDNLTNTRVKLSTTSVAEGYSDIGSDVPMHNSGENYFVLKGNSSAVSEMAYMAVSAEGFGYYSDVPGHDFKYGEFNVNELPSTWYGIALYQGLSTTVKQWD